MNWQWEHITLYIIAPALFVGAVVYGLFFAERKAPGDKKYQVRFQLSIEDMNQKYYRRDGTSSCNHIIFHWQLRRLQLMGAGAHQPGRKMTISFIIARSATFH